MTKDEGGRHTPFFNGYRPQFYFRTTDVTGTAHLPEGVEMVMPGDNVEMTVELIAPIAMDEGLRFAIREGGRTVGAGRVRRRIRRSRDSHAQARRSASSSGRTTTEMHRPVDARRSSSTVARTGAQGASGPVPLPTEQHRYTVIRSPHKDKDSREHFEMLTHKRLIDIVERDAQDGQELQRLNLPAGVDIEIKLQGSGRWPSQGDPGREAGHDARSSTRRRAVPVTVIRPGPCFVTRR